MDKQIAFSEATVEAAALSWFQDAGYFLHSGQELSPDSEPPLRSSYEDVVLRPRLLAALRRINPHVPDDAIELAATVVTRPPEADVFRNNRWFHRQLIDGVPVEYRGGDGVTRGDRVLLLDTLNPAQNDFMVASQVSVRCGNNTRRLDIVIYVNGLPVGVVELKDPTDDDVNVWDAYRQLQEYKEAIPSLFVYNELMIVSDGNTTRVGSVTSGADRYALWRSIDNDRDPGPPSLESVVVGLFAVTRLPDYLRYCITFEEDRRTGLLTKRVASYHQFRAVIRARQSVQRALKPTGDGRGGVVWHTQGSGKSLTMLMLAGNLIGDKGLGNPTLVVLTDRNDLDDQLFQTFAAGRELLRQPPEQAATRNDLAFRLGRASGGVVFTTIQKFAERTDAVSERSDIVVLADEAHRSQYGFLQGGARWMRTALPNATFVGFTGTPIQTDDRSTIAVFGDCIDSYDIRKAIDDGSTVPIFYEMRLIRLLPDEEGIEQAQQQIDAAAALDAEGRLSENTVAIPLKELVGSSQRLALVAAEIVRHFEARRAVIEGKAMIVCMTREICMYLHDKIAELRPEWVADEDQRGLLKVVMTGTRSEGDRVAQHARTKSRRELLARRFADPDTEFRLAIVCDMWLTGFDCPPLHTMYLDRPLAGHNLMQAIARVNRVLGEKPGGVIVDFLGIANELRDAVNAYTDAGGVGSPVRQVAQEAVPLMLRHFEAVSDFFGKFDYGTFAHEDSRRRVQMVTSAVDFVLDQPDGKARFLGLVDSLSRAFALAVPAPETLAVRDPLVFFQSVRAAIRKRLSESGPPPSDTHAAVRQVISGAVSTDGIVDLFEVAGIADANVGILSDEFLDGLAALPQRNLALDALRKLLNDQITSREHVNIVESRDFRNALEQLLVRYSNRAISTAQVIDELILLARYLRERVGRGDETGLTDAELAFYDALADNGSAREAMQDETLRRIARELSDRIRSKASLDWTQRETVRADMRRTVRRLLAKYGYPPDAQEGATQLIIRQAELMAEGLTAR